MMNERNIDCVGVNAKFIFFKDYECDYRPMVESRFFKLPDEIENLQNLLKTIDYWGGGDIPDNSLEALYFALISKFPEADEDVTVHNKIVLFTASAAKPFYGSCGTSHPEDFGNINRVPYSLEVIKNATAEVVDGNIIYNGSYPYIFPPSFDQFREFFNSKSDLECLYIFAPEAFPWDEMKNWDKVKYRKQNHIVMNDDDLEPDFVFNFII